VRGIDCRFTAPAYPGETIRTQMWLDGPTLRFRAFVEDRMVGDNGWAIFFEQSGANCG
jgi:acyl dehydratase